MTDNSMVYAQKHLEYSYFAIYSLIKNNGKPDEDFYRYVDKSAEYLVLINQNIRPHLEASSHEPVKSTKSKKIETVDRPCDFIVTRGPRKGKPCEASCVKGYTKCKAHKGEDERYADKSYSEGNSLKTSFSQNEESFTSSSGAARKGTMLFYGEEEKKVPLERRDRKPPANESKNTSSKSLEREYQRTKDSNDREQSSSNDREYQRSRECNDREYQRTKDSNDREQSSSNDREYQRSRECNDREYQRSTEQSSSNDREYQRRTREQPSETSSNDHQYQRRTREQLSESSSNDRENERIREQSSSNERQYQRRTREQSSEYSSNESENQRTTREQSSESSSNDRQYQRRTREQPSEESTHVDKPEIQRRSSNEPKEVEIF